MIHTLPALHALVLAAGASRRYGSPKQLALIDGVPMLRRVIDTAVSVLPHDAEGPRVTVVLGAHASAIRAAIDLREVREVHCAEWNSGMAHSLRCGLATLGSARADPTASTTAAAPAAALVMLGDTPYVTAPDLRRLIDAWQAAPDTPTAAEYDGTVGAPCILPHSVWPEVMTLEGDHGAGAWLRQRIALARPVSTSSIHGAARDIDHPSPC